MKERYSRLVLQGCLERTANLGALSDKDLKQKCELNGIATVDYSKKAVPRYVVCAVCNVRNAK